MNRIGTTESQIVKAYDLQQQARTSSVSVNERVLKEGSNKDSKLETVNEENAKSSISLKKSKSIDRVFKEKYIDLILFVTSVKTLTKLI